VWWATHAPLSSEALLQNVLAGFRRPIVGVGIFIPDGDSPTGILKLLHDMASYPGTTGRPRDCMEVFEYEGDVSGVDISTVAFSSQQLNTIPDVIIPGSVVRVQQLLIEEPNHETLGPFKATDANMRTIKTRALRAPEAFTGGRPHFPPSIRAHRSSPCERRTGRYVFPAHRLFDSGPRPTYRGEVRTLYPHPSTQNSRVHSRAGGY
jgi:hypothetical protein